jgi:16S rRNA (cytosine967-C5)-methyltransferase
MAARERAAAGFAVSPARREAFAILMAVGRGEAHSDEMLRGARVLALSAQDRGLCTALVLGVLRWQTALDARIRKLLAKPGARVDEAVLTALRMGAFQLWFLDRIPAHAAIGESVALAKKAGHRFASGMVNAVLRKAAAMDKEANVEEAYLRSFSGWMVERWERFYGGEAAREICRQGQMEPELTIRVVDADADQMLASDGIICAPGLLLKAARRVTGGEVTATEAFRAGRVRIQEEGSQLIAELSRSGGFGPRRILDCCAAPGGKTLGMAEANPEAHVTGCEISKPRFEALRRRIDAASADNHALADRVDLVPGDVTQLALPQEYDFVLADVPCSGTGTLGRNPEIRHRLAVEDLGRFHERQCAILRAALAAAGSGARVVYSTCSLEPEENEAVVAEVLAGAPGWRCIALGTILAELHAEGRVTDDGLRLLTGCLREDGSLLLLPGALGREHSTDGFFMAMLERGPVSL